MAEVGPSPPVEREVRDALSGLAGKEEVETVQALRQWAHRLRLAYEALMDEGFSEAQAILMIERLYQMQEPKLEPVWMPSTPTVGNIPNISPYITPVTGSPPAYVFPTPSTTITNATGTTKLPVVHL